METIKDLAKNYSLKVHLDGARLFNAATYLNVDVKEITRHCDSVMFCLSKGLCAPVGSILAGSKEFIAQARKKRKIMGGGLRQSGVLAGPGLVALDRMVPRLHEDHTLALKLGEALNKIEGVHVFSEDIHINMVFFTLPDRFNPEQLVHYLLENGVKVNGPENGIWRFVTHHDITEADMQHVVALLAAY